MRLGRGPGVSVRCAGAVGLTASRALADARSGLSIYQTIGAILERRRFHLQSEGVWPCVLASCLRGLARGFSEAIFPREPWLPHLTNQNLRQ